MALSIIPVVDIEEEIKETYKKYFNPDCNIFYRYGEVGQMLHTSHLLDMYRIKTMEIRKDDVWIMGQLRSGTTWTGEITWLLNNNLDFKTASEKKLSNRSLYFVGYRFIKDIGLDEFQTKDFFTFDEINNWPGPRQLKSHITFPLLPDNLLDRAKVVYVMRNPKDVIVSRYHYERTIKISSYHGDFKFFLQFYLEGKLYYGPHFLSIKEAWARRHHPNLLIIFYEDLVNDTEASYKKIAKFLNKSYSDEQIAEVVKFTQFEKMYKSKFYGPAGKFTVEGTSTFVRQGKIGRWSELMDAEMEKQVEDWIAKNLSDPEYLPIRQKWEGIK